jgi:DNA repair exonuclease SbcCD nuclease subunit
MKNMKILHCADIHLGRRPLGAVGEYSKKRYEDYFNAFNWAVDTAINNKVDIFLIAGDFFDKKELLPEVLEKAEKSLGKLKSRNIPVILIEGNHDNVTRGNETDSWLIYLENKGLLKRPDYHTTEESYQFDNIKIGDINIYGVGYPGSFVNETLVELSNFLDDKKHEKNIVLVHTAIGDDKSRPGTVMKETIELFADRALYVAGGHFHNYNTFPSNNPYFYRPGSLEYWDVDEINQRKGVIIFDTDGKSHQFYDSPKRHAYNVTYSINSKNNDDFKIEFLEKLDKLQIIPNETVMKITFDLSISFPLDISLCENILAEKGILKSFIKINLPEAISDIDINNPLIEKVKIEQDIIKKWNNLFSDDYLSTSQTLEKLKYYQKENMENLFFDEYDNFLENILTEKEVKNED